VWKSTVDVNLETSNTAFGVFQWNSPLPGSYGNILLVDFYDKCWCKRLLVRVQNEIARRATYFSFLVKKNMTSSLQDSKPSSEIRQGLVGVSSNHEGTTGISADSSRLGSIYIDQPSLVALVSRAQCEPTVGGVDIFLADISESRSQRLELVEILDKVLSITSPADILRETFPRQGKADKQ
jgi:hypothetical protein